MTTTATKAQRTPGPYQPNPEHFAAMRDFHYRAADFLAKEISKHKLGSPMHRKLTADCASALELAEQARAALKGQA